nr:MAG TPA: hypothetical protein [Caudoviricetes sp.]
MEKSTKSNKTPYSHCNVTVTGNIWLQVKAGGGIPSFRRSRRPGFWTSLQVMAQHCACRPHRRV